MIKYLFDLKNSKKLLDKIFYKVIINHIIDIIPFLKKILFSISWILSRETYELYSLYLREIYVFGFIQTYKITDKNKLKKRKIYGMILFHLMMFFQIFHLSLLKLVLREN